LREFGCTTLMITHNMEHALASGDRLIVMSRGRVAAEFGAAQKARLSPGQVVEEITRQGDVVSDRSLLADGG
jgi:putative ABC transport system ATP-binding protein